MVRPRPSRVLLAIGGLLVGLLILLASLPVIVARVVRTQLQSTISEQLDARLSLGSVEYRFPYGIRLRDARVIAADTTGREFDLVAASEVELALSKCPLLPGPFLIERIDVRSPAVHLIQTTAGLVGQAILRDDKPAADRKQKLSELFELTTLTVGDASIVFDDRTIAGSVPLVWRGLRLDLKTARQGPAVYGFDATGDGGPTASLVARGTMDIDRLFMRLASCDVRVTVDPAAKESPLPATVQAALATAKVSGTVTVALSGEMPLADPRESVLTATIDLPHATGQLPGAAAPLDELSARATCWAQPKSLTLSLTQLKARSGDASVSMAFPKATFTVATGVVKLDDLALTLTPGHDRRGLPAEVVKALESTEIAGSVVVAGSIGGTVNNGQWSTETASLRIAPDGLAIRAAMLPDALHDFAAFTVEADAASGTIRGFRAGYGNDVFFLREARVALAELAERFRLDKLAGAMTFDAKRATYPPAIETNLLDAEPRGPFFFDGTAVVDRSLSTGLDYRIRVTSERAALSPMRLRVPMLDLVSDIVVTPALATIDRFDANALSGTIGASGTVRLQPDIAFGAAVRLRKIDLNSLAYAATAPGEKPMTVAGELDADVTCTGVGLGESLRSSFKADGAIRVDRGELFHIPTLEAITRGVGLRSVATLSEASATFSIADRAVHLSDASIGSPAVGVRASGTIGFDKSLDLQAIATPLDDWEKNLRGTGERPVANVVANVAGSVQRAMNKVTEEYLYRVHVTGTTDQPDVRVVAAPSLRGEKK